MSTAVLAVRPYVPPRDDITIPQLVFDYAHPTRPARPLEVPCFIDDETGRSIYFQDLKDRTSAFSAWLKAKTEFGNDDVLALCIPNHSDYGPICWGAQDVGGIIAAMNPALTVSEMEHQLKLVDPKIVIAHDSTLPNIQRAILKLSQKPTILLVGSPPTGQNLYTFDRVIEEAKALDVHTVGQYKLNPGESKHKIALLCFSSGTTGPPKAVALSHYNFATAVLQTISTQGVNDHRIPYDQARFRVGDIVTGVLPFSHIYGHGFNLHIALYCGMTVILSGPFNFEKMLKDIVKYKINTLFLVPPQATLLVKHPSVVSYDLSHIRCLALAAAPLPIELATAVSEKWPNAHFGQCYGFTEGTGAVSMWPISQKVGKFGTCGVLLPAGKHKVVKADGSLAEKGEPGELLIKGDHVALGYYKNTEATNEAWLEDGWLRSGDKVLIDEDDNLVVVDRMKELIKVKGNQVSPAELEGHLLSHPDVADVGVVGILDEYAGELPVAFVVLKEAARTCGAHSEEAEKAKLMKYVSDTKSRYKWLKDVHLLSAIPRNPSGKILRRLLRDGLENGRYRSASRSVKAHL
ncbi:acetyl-CoA synthetase-like protein [Trametopsis cervina]|nr:acetyl-CoA synthetase-like protein [Trametopsis cervina]